MNTKINCDDKAIYEILNYAEIEDNLNENFQMDEVTKKRIKNKINKKLNNKKRKVKYAATAAIALICLVTVTISNPTLAANIQNSIIHTMEKLRGDNGEYEKYKSNVNLESYDKGIKFVINEIVSDSNKIVFSYSIISDEKLKDLVSNINISEFNFRINGERMKTGGYGGSGYLVNDNRYDGVIEVNTMRAKLPDTFNLNININLIDEVNGNWNFAIKVDKKEIEKETKEYEINKEINLGEDKLIIKRIATSPLSIAMEVSGAMWKYRYFVFDDEGNMINFNGGNAEENVGELQFGALVNKDTKLLTFLPAELNEDYKPNPRVYDIGNLPLELEQGNLGKLIVNKLEWSEDTLKVSYNAEGKIPVAQAQGLCLVDENNNFINPENEFSSQKDSSNQHEFEMIFKGVSKDKKYKIATLRLEEFYILHDEYKFTIELKN
ncbi:MAG: DUF4179 domain-containing protein [Clostridiaceae bacterium]